MRALLDSHALLWLFSEDPALSKTAFEAIAHPQNEILVSAASAWEIALKVQSGKLPSGVDLVQDFAQFLRRAGFYEMSISIDHGIRAGLLPTHHKDPFDRVLAAQCQAESIPIISNDRVFELYGVNRIW
ncbi:MAG TPA: type II toxin-antitoxin system VapC family toxin [Candidatus Acidoferrales bacterium]